MSKTPAKEILLQLLFAAAKELNQQLPRNKKLVLEAGTILTGTGGTLDSLGLLNLTVLFEQKIEEEFTVSVSLAEGAAITEDQGPFHSLGSLAEHAQRLVEQKLNG